MRPSIRASLRAREEDDKRTVTAEKATDDTASTLSLVHPLG